MIDVVKKQEKRKQLIFGDGELKKATFSYESTEKGKFRFSSILQNTPLVVAHALETLQDVSRSRIQKICRQEEVLLRLCV